MMSYFRGLMLGVTTLITACEGVGFETTPHAAALEVVSGDSYALVVGSCMPTLTFEVEGDKLIVYEESYLTTTAQEGNVVEAILPGCRDEFSASIPTAQIGKLDKISDGTATINLYPVPNIGLFQ